ncbi:MAG: hypothetical protein GM46_9640 [actinobacterium acAcidi]|nr:MAG: hypothetical protein GM46_9640 [actinobacterium acAcidi]
MDQMGDNVEDDEWLATSRVQHHEPERLLWRIQNNLGKNDMVKDDPHVQPGTNLWL